MISFNSALRFAVTYNQTIMAEVEDVLKKEIAHGNSPSVQYILFGKDNIIKECSLGLADISENRKVNDRTTYNAFSVTKTFTALAILQLAEQKSIDIEKPVQLYLSSFPFSSEITIRQLLSHTAGIPNPIPLSWIHLATEHKSFDRNQFFERIFIKNNKIKTKPNQKFAYSNLGYVLLGQLIEKLTGISYEEYITNNIIQRLRLTQDELGFEILHPHQHAKGYQKNLSLTNLILGLLINKSKFMGKAEGKWKPFVPNYVNGVSYGGLIGTPGSFVKYIQQLLRPENLLLSEHYKKWLFTESFTTNGRPTGMCLSWFRGQLNGNTYYTHAGGGGGYYCEIRIYPDRELGSVIFFNRTGMSDEQFLDKVDRFYF
jgi:D-alanyl-D-alanine carboxypeptidase